MNEKNASTMVGPSYALKIDEIKKFLPHRSPFLLVDRILEIVPTGDVNDPQPGPSKIGTRVKGLKNVSYNEPFFQGHFPDMAIMPGVLILEAMAQVASFSQYPFLIQNIERIHEDFQCILLGVDGARFRRPVVPGDTLIFDSVVKKCREKIWSFEVKVTVDGALVAQADILAQMALKKAVV